MAEFGAHLTSATDQRHPSFFEVLAQESLTQTLRPALNHLLKFIAERDPANYRWLFRFSDEIYTSMNLILQHHFLNTTCASFSENFYGMKRIPADTSKANASLSYWDHWTSLIFLVVVPYTKQKLDQLFERWKEEEYQGSRAHRSHLQQLKHVYTVIYPFLHMGWEGSFLVYHMRYLFKKSKFHSPFMQLAGLKLSYLSEDDIVSHTDEASSISQVKYARFPPAVQRTLKKIISVIAIGLSQGLSVGVFFLQFLEWWYMYGDHQAHLAITSLPIPPPPQKDENSYSTNGTICPLCQRQRTNDTALSTSGYVFCYPCIYSYLKKHNCCPVTKYPSSLTQLTKLYPPSD